MTTLPPDYWKNAPEGEGYRDAAFYRNNKAPIEPSLANGESAAPADDGAADSRVAKVETRDVKPPAPFANIINPAEWEGVEVPDPKWIVPDYIPDETVTMLSGDGGQGKSTLALQLAVARARAREWIGLLPAPGRTLVLSAEDGRDELHRRLDRMRKSAVYSATWADFADIRLIDLVGEDSVLGALMHGQILPTEMFRILDAFMTDFEPGLTILDVLADMFGGDEVKRAQVRQFINLLKGLCRKHGSAILLLAHPSIAGMNSGSGLSGSTDWNNGVRARMYLQTPKNESGDPLNKNLRTLEGMKSNYGERGGKIDLEWKNGLFIPVHGPGGFDKLAAEQKAEEAFLANLKRRNSQSRTISDKSGANYAPAVFAKEPEATSAGINRKQLEAAMERLFKAGKIRVETKGPPSRQTRSIVIADERDG